MRGFCHPHVQRRRAVLRTSKQITFFCQKFGATPGDADIFSGDPDEDDAAIPGTEKVCKCIQSQTTITSSDPKIVAPAVLTRIGMLSDPSSPKRLLWFDSEMHNSGNPNLLLFCPLRRFDSPGEQCCRYAGRCHFQQARVFFAVYPVHRHSGEPEFGL